MLKMHAETNKQPLLTVVSVGLETSRQTKRTRVSQNCSPEKSTHMSLPLSPLQSNELIVKVLQSNPAAR